MDQCLAAGPVRPVPGDDHAAGRPARRRRATRAGSPSGSPAPTSGWAGGPRPKRYWTPCRAVAARHALRADIAFCHGDFAQAEELATAALGQVSGPLREGFLFRLAEIELYRGRFGDAREHARGGLGDGTRRGERHPGEPDGRTCSPRSSTSPATWTSQRTWSARRWPASRCGEQERDQALLAGLLQNAALVNEATGDWQNGAGLPAAGAGDPPRNRGRPRGSAVTARDRQGLPRAWDAPRRRTGPGRSRAGGRRSR